MSLRVVLFTRSSRPSGAQMLWRLLQEGFPPVAVVVEKREKMLLKKKKGGFIREIGKFGARFLGNKILETVKIRWHYYGRKFLGKKFHSPDYLSVEELALDYSFPLYWVDDHNGEEAQKLLRSLDPDIGVLTNTRRIKKEILDIPRFGFFNLHLSELPQYAGLDSIFWALYHGEKEIGATVHFAAEAIDQGDIVLQKKIPVSSFDTESTLYTKALWLGTRLMIQALDQLEKGTLAPIPQRTGAGSYFSWPTGKERSSYARSLKAKRQDQKPSQSIRVLHFITRMIRGGAQVNTLATCRGLLKKGYDVTLVTGLPWGREGEILSEALEDGMEVVILPDLIREIHLLKDLKVFLSFVALLKRNHYTAVHTHTSKAGLIGRFAAALCKIPIVIHTPHGHVFHSYFSRWKEKFFLSLERLAARSCDRLIALTEVEKQEHLALEVGKPGQWVTIPSGIDEKMFSHLTVLRKQELRGIFGIPGYYKIIGYAGRLATIKGPQYFLEAIPQIRQEMPETFFLFVGDGGERSYLEKRAFEELGLKESVRFTGHQTQVSDLMNLFDILVVPSLNEGMGRVIAEAGLLAKPVIATRVGGILDLIVDQETGLLVNPREPQEIAQAVIGLLGNPALALRLGENLREKVLSGFTERQMVESINDLYGRMLQEKEIIRPLSSQGIMTPTEEITK